MNTKQVIVFRKDLLKGEHAIRKGKFAGQVAHASLSALLKCFNEERVEPVHNFCGDLEPGQYFTRYSLDMKDGSMLDQWMNGIYTKVVVSVENEEELLKIKEQIDKRNKDCVVPIPYALITDCGKTEFNGVPTNTCIGIGPFESEELDKITGNLPLL